MKATRKGCPSQLDDTLAKAKIVKFAVSLAPTAMKTKIVAEQVAVVVGMSEIMSAVGMSGIVSTVGMSGVMRAIDTKKIVVVSVVGMSEVVSAVEMKNIVVVSMVGMSEVVSAVVMKNIVVVSEVEMSGVGMTAVVKKIVEISVKVIAVATILMIAVTVTPTAILAISSIFAKRKEKMFTTAEDMWLISFSKHPSS